MKNRFAAVAGTLFLGQALMVTLSAIAAPAATPVRAEMETLLGHLGSSGCMFNRNGDWYPASEAREHLLMKLGHIEARGTLKSTEDFIELAASKSSMSGKPYLVRCGDAAPVHSGTWLLARLAHIRAASAGPRKPYPP